MSRITMPMQTDLIKVIVKVEKLLAAGDGHR
jgi:hypothetical protein